MSALLRVRAQCRIRRCGKRSRGFALAVVLALGFPAVLPVAARSLPTDPCGAIKESEIALAFGLKDAIKHNKLLAEPGNPAGVVRTRCGAFAWRGPKPTSDRRKREALLAGTFASLTIQSWTPDETPQADLWRARFAEVLKRRRTAASELFLEKLDGTRLLPARFGAESAIVFSAAPGLLHRVRGFWWSHELKSLLVFDAVEAKGEPTVAALKQIASIVVSEFFRRPGPPV